MSTLISRYTEFHQDFIAQFQRRTERLKYYKHLKGTMTCFQVWQGVDRLSFFENAILLELKARSQGKPVKMHSPNIDGNDTLRQESRNFLDDFALVASGPGGPDNVAAASMEISEINEKNLVVRVARNGGLNDEMLCRIKGTIRTIIENSSSGLSNLSPDFMLYL